MGSKKSSILDELAALPAGRGDWIKRLTKEQRADLEKVRQASARGEVTLSVPVLSHLIAKFQIKTSPGGLRVWLKR